MDAVSGADAILRKLMELEPQGAGPDGPGLLVRLWPYLETHGCETMVIEEHVVDEEYFREFLHFYATTFIEHPSTATRLHFFSANADAVEALLDPLSDGQIHAQEAYLGYTVLRPTSPLTVGETLLRIPADGTSGRCYTHCATRFGQTLRGRRLSVAAAPFIGQDQTGVCAHSAIWGAMKYLHKYRYYPKTSMPDIAMMATRGVLATRFTRPAEGLTDPQMYSVFLQMGFQIYYAELSPGNPALDSPLEVAYSCIESGLPS